MGRLRIRAETVAPRLGSGVAPWMKPSRCIGSSIATQSGRPPSNSVVNVVPERGSPVIKTIGSPMGPRVSQSLLPSQVGASRISCCPRRAMLELLVAEGRTGC